MNNYHFSIQKIRLNKILFYVGFFYCKLGLEFNLLSMRWHKPRKRHRVFFETKLGVRFACSPSDKFTLDPQYVVLITSRTWTKMNNALGSGSLFLFVITTRESRDRVIIEITWWNRAYDLLCFVKSCLSPFNGMFINGSF